MKSLILTLTFFISIHFFAQHEADNWVFGTNAGISFQTGNPVSFSSSLIPMNTMEGCGSISDANGNLLFYVGANNQNATTLTVWVPYDNNGDGIHDTMQGGASLIGHVSATQAVIIVPKPNDSNIYYIFTVDQIQIGSHVNRGLYYYTVDMSQNGGIGAVVGTGVQLLSKTAEKITAVKSADCNSIWVITYSSLNGESTSHDTFHAFNVSSAGVSLTSVTSSSGIGAQTDGRGYMKVSPQGDKLAIAHTGDQVVCLYDFNNTTGVVSNPLILSLPLINNVYGVEFSKNGSKLYVTTYNSHGQDTSAPNDSFLYQFDLTAAQPELSGVEIDAVYNDLYRTSLQLGPDGKIYRTMPTAWGVLGGSQFLSVINNPDAAGAASNYVANVVDLGIGRSHQGLPPFIQSLFVDDLDIIHDVTLNSTQLNLCTGNTYTIFADDSTYPTGTTYAWTLDDNPIPVTTNSITLDNTGTYNNGTFEVTVTFPNNACPQIGSAEVTYFTQAVAHPVADWLICDSDNNGLHTFNLSTLNATVLGGQNPANFGVTYHTSLADAQNNVNSLTLNYTNALPYVAQTIYIRVQNNACTTCYDIEDFVIDVFNTPTANTPPNMVVCDDNTVGNDTDGLHQFSLNLQNNTILNSQSATQYTITYHLNQNDADNDVNPLPLVYNNISNPQTIFVRIENVDHAACYDTTSFSLVVNSLPVLHPASVVLEQCDDDLDGFVAFNLNEANVLISLDYQNETFTYFTSLYDAQHHINPIAQPEAYVNPTQPTSTVWAEIMNANGCSRIKEVDLLVATTQIPDSFVIQYTECDNLLVDNNDFNGIVPFDLTAANAQIESLFPNPQNVVITYYNTLNDALTEQNSITNLSNYQNIGFPHHHFIWVRVDSQDSNACLGLGQHIELIVNPLPVYPSNVTDYEVCNASQVYPFDLTTKDAEIINGQSDVSVSYHAYLIDAQNGTNPLASPFNNSNNPQNIYVRLENTLTGCVNAYGSFQIQVNQLPIVSNVSDFDLCDDDTNDGIAQFILQDKTPEVLGSQTGIAVTYYLSQTDADNGSNELPNNYTNVTNPQTIYYQMYNVTTHCMATGQFDLVVNDSPVIFTPTALQICDPDSDGIHHFNLHLKDSEIAGALVGQVNVTYHETLTDAQLGVTDIPDFSNYDNIQAWNQIIYVRVENLTTGCFDTTTLELIVNPTPQINFEPEPFVHCDDNYDGHLQVNLNDHLPEILGTIQATDVQVSYYHSQAEAWAEVNPIVNYLAYYTLINPETIWVRVEYALTNCASVAPFEIIINPLPTTITPTPLSMCDNDDDGEDNNGYVQTFDLHTKDQEILNGQIGSVTYHYTQVEAETNTNAIASPFTNAVPHVQTLWVRITLATGCYALTTMDVRVEPLPTPLEPNPLEACDTDADGYAEFDLTDPQMWFEVQQGEIGTTLTFHETEMDAHNDVNALPNNYTNISTQDQSQIIYVRDTYTATGCYRIVPLLLVAQPSPQLQTPDDLQTCDDTTAIPVGQSSFTLTDAIAQTLGDIDPTTVTVTFHINQNDANSGSFPIDTTQAYNNLANHQEIWIRVEDNQTGCYNVTSFHLDVNPLPVVPNPVPSMTQCDDDTDGQNQFYLDTMNAGIVGAQTGLVVYYFETLAQAQANDPTTWLISPYTNQSNPQTLHVRVENLNTGCYSLTTMDLRVIPMPNITDQPQEYHECDSTSGTDTDGQGLFDLTTLNPTITNNQSDVTVVYYYDQALVNSINTPNNFQNTSNPQTVYALVTSNLNGCTGVVTINLIVDPQPIANPPADTYICSTTIPNQYLANLHTDLDHLVVNDPTGLTITYHATSAQAQANTAPLNNNLLVSNGTQLWVRLTTQGGCWTVGGPYTIRFATPPTINPYTIPQAICDADGNGSEVFDLTAVGTQIIGTQANVTATYYQLQGTTQTAITTPGAYIANVGTTTIVIDLENTVTQCTNTTQFTIEVYPKPSVTIQASSDMYCINEQAVNLTAIPTSSEDATHTYTYQWMLGTTAVGTTSTIAVSQGGTYQVTITNANGCIATATHQVEASQQSTMQLEDLDLTYWQNANTLTIPTETPYGIGDYVYSIDGGTPTTQTTYTNLMGGTHTLEIIDLNGCLTQTITFTILDYMRFFTPNGDGYNDTWNLLGGDTQPGAQINIFDRYGKLIAQVDPTGEGWNGLYNGFQMPSTDYWFTIELTDGTIKKGHFSLVRR